MTEPISAEDVIVRIDDWRGRDVRCDGLGSGLDEHRYARMQPHKLIADLW